jgi:hypothetical protein
MNLTADTTALRAGLRRAAAAVHDFEVLIGKKRPTPEPSATLFAAPAPAPGEVRHFRLFCARKDQRRKAIRWAVGLVVGAALLLTSPADAATPSLRHTRRMTRITVLRPARVQGRIATGRPFLMTMFHTAKSVDNVTANLRIGRIIGDILFTPFRQ